MRLDVVDGSAIFALAERVALAPGRYRRVVFAAPFIDEVGVRSICRVRHIHALAGPRIDLFARCPKAVHGLAHRGVIGLHAVTRLHAKVAVALGHDPKHDELIITSANLTRAAFRTNLEIGVRLRGSDAVRQHARHVIQALAGRNRKR